MTATQFATRNALRKAMAQLVYDFQPSQHLAQLLGRTHGSESTRLPRVPLMVSPTPLNPWSLPDVDLERFQLRIKRDDMTGSTLSGNKVRKLEFLLADALTQGCTTVITCGGLQSNHCRATAIAAKELGLDAELFLRSPEPRLNVHDVTGNLALNLVAGARVHLVKPQPYETGLKPAMEQRAEEIAKAGGKAYTIPVGGSNTVGLWGFMVGFEELLAQSSEVTDIVCAIGSGGTTEGLAIANYLHGSPFRIHAICVCDSGEEFYVHIDKTIADVGLMSRDQPDQPVRARDIVNIIDGFKGRGYAKSTPEELDFIKNVADSTGIILDPVYSGKAAFGLRHLLRERAGMFAGSNVVFWHTGGVFGLLDGRMSDVVDIDRLVSAEHYSA